MPHRFDVLFFAKGKFIRPFKWIYCRVFFILNLIKINYYSIPFDIRLYVSKNPHTLTSDK